MTLNAVLTLLYYFLTYKMLRYIEKKMQKLLVIITICKDKHVPKYSNLISSCLRVGNQLRENLVNRHEGSQSVCRNFYSWFPLYLTFGHPVAMRLKGIKTKKNSRKWSWFCTYQFAGHWCTYMKQKIWGNLRGRTENNSFRHF